MKTCSFKNKQSDATLTLFAHDENGCKNPFVDLSLAVVGNQYRIQHRLFVFGNELSSEYELTCQIKLCELLHHQSNECDNIMYDCAIKTDYCSEHDPCLNGAWCSNEPKVEDTDLGYAGVF